MALLAEELVRVLGQGLAREQARVRVREPVPVPVLLLAEVKARVQGPRLLFVPGIAKTKASERKYPILQQLKSQYRIVSRGIPSSC